MGFSDGRATSPGATGQSTHRNAPGRLNLAWMSTYTWANPALTTLERQAEVPLFGDDPVEMGVTDGNRDEVLSRLRRDPDYPRHFAQAFPAPQPISFDSVTKALAASISPITCGERRRFSTTLPFTISATPSIPIEECSN